MLEILKTTFDYDYLLTSIPLFTHCRTVHRNSKYPPSLLTSGLNRILDMLQRWSSSAWLKKITASCYWVELI